MLRFVLQKGGYPDDPDDSIALELGPEATWKGARLFSMQKQATRDVVLRAAASGSYHLTRLLLSYLTPLLKRRPLDPGSREAISTSIFSAASKGHTDIVPLIPDVGYNIANQDAVSSPVSDVSIVPSRAEIINDFLVNAADSGALSTLNRLLEQYGTNVNFAQNPHHVTTSYRAAGNGKTDVVQCLIKDYSANIHAGNSRYASGPTVLWVAVLNQHVETVEALLELDGPVKSFDADAKEGTEEV